MYDFVSPNTANKNISSCSYLSFLSSSSSASSPSSLKTNLFHPIHTSQIYWVIACDPCNVYKKCVDYVTITQFGSTCLYIDDFWKLYWAHGPIHRQMYMSISGISMEQQNWDMCLPISKDNKANLQTHKYTAMYYICLLFNESSC